MKSGRGRNDMEKLKKEDKDKISQILHNNWDLIFKLLVDSSTDEYGIPYRELYKWELSDREKEYNGSVVKTKI